jgi:type II secretory pathway pseudopilin PulG
MFRIGSRARVVCGFTIIELLLVVAIMMLTTLLAVPMLARSYRGAKLRTSVRTIVMIHRHARSMAVLGQKQIGVLFDKDQNRVEVASVSATVSSDDKSKFIDQQQITMTESEQDKNKADTESVQDEAPPPVDSELSRHLAEGVKIMDVESEKKDQEYKGIFWVTYYPSGMCDKYTVFLEDSNSKKAEIKIDPLSGKVEVDYE